MRYKKSQIRGVYLIFFVISSFFFVYPFAGGDGSISNPYNISTCAHLQNMSSNLNANYQLITNIDCSGVDFKPIGNCSGSCSIFDSNDNPFNGNFDGRNNTISDVNITDPSSDSGWGFFGFTNYSNVKDTILNNVVIDVPNANDVGGLVGHKGYGSVDNSLVNGDVTGKFNVGGLVGYNYGDIQNSYTNVTLKGNSTVGGLVGYHQYGTIENSFAEGNVNGTTDVGGLVGRIENAGEIRNSYSTGNVSGTNRIGGIVGLTNYGGDIINSYSSGNVHGDGNVGGILGVMYYGSIENSFAMGNVNGTTNVGGLVGEITVDGNVENSFATGSVNGTTNVGGFVGENDGGTISNSYYYNFSGNPDTAIGLDNDGQSVSAETSISYFYSQSNLPLNSWNTSIWEFSGTGFPTITIQNTGNGGVFTEPNSASSLFPFGGFLISLTLILFFFMS